MVEGAEVPRELKILVVEDDTTWERIFGREVGGNDASMIPALSAEKGIEVLESGNPVAGVVTDGLEGGWRRMAEAAAKKGVPVLVISAIPSIVKAAKLKGLSAVGKDELGWPSVLSDFVEAARGAN